MFFRSGTRVLVTLLDGSTLHGTARFTWRPRTLRLVDVTTLSVQGEAMMAGELRILRHAILYVQTGV